MPVNGTQLARMIDASLFHANTSWAETEKMLQIAKDNHFYAVFGVAVFYPQIIETLKGSDVHVGSACGNIMITSELKSTFAKRNIDMGCHEVDMVMNLPAFKSGLYDDVVRDIRMVREAVGDHVLKCIIETPLLSDDEIRKACELVVEGGADYVKTAVGVYGPTTVHHVEVMSDAVKGRIKLKAAGGIRSLETIQ